MKISIVVCCVFSFPLLAQPDSTQLSPRKVIYFNHVLAGGLFGEEGDGSGLSISTTHGIRVKRLALGAGVAFDSYGQWKTIPAFGSISYDFAKIKSNAFFLQFNAGYANASRIKKEEWADYREYGSQMICSLIGYRIRTQQFSLYVQAGHRFQKVSYSYDPTPWASQLHARYTVDEEINRVVVQIGFGLH